MHKDNLFHSLLLFLLIQNYKKITQMIQTAFFSLNELTSSSLNEFLLPDAFFKRTFIIARYPSTVHINLST